MPKSCFGGVQKWLVGSACGSSAPSCGGVPLSSVAFRVTWIFQVATFDFSLEKRKIQVKFSRTWGYKNWLDGTIGIEKSENWLPLDSYFDFQVFHQSNELRAALGQSHSAGTVQGLQRGES